MTHENKDEETVDTPPEKKPRLTLVLILAILLGTLLTLLIAGTIYHVQSGKALAAELAATKDELKRKTALFAELQEQVAGLSRQMHALREFSVAKANAVAAATSEPPVAPATNTPPASSEPETKKEKPVSTPAAKKAEPTAQDCQLVGKSPEEQSATLKRCMQSVDGKGSRR